MVQEIVHFLLQHNIVAVIFYKVLYLSVIGSLVGILIYLIRNVFDTKISPKWKCIMWGIFIVSLLIPFRFEIKTQFKYPNTFIDEIETIPETVVSKANEIEDSNENLLESNLLVSDLINNNQIEEKEETIQLSNKQNYDFKNILLIIIIPYIWIIGSAIFITNFAVGYFSIVKKIKGKKCEDIIVNSILRDCLKQLNIKKNIKIYYYNYKKVISLFGIFNSKILISRDYLNLDDESLKYVFMHELTHYKRKDLVLNLLMLLMISIHFFNPVVWFMFKKIRADIELATDEGVVEKLQKNQIKEYGLTLINMLNLNQTNDYTINFLCMTDTEKNMERRIKMIKNPLKNKSISILIALIAILLIGIIIFVRSSKEETILTPIEQNIKTLSENYEHLWTEPKEITSVEEYEKLHESNLSGSYSDLSEEELSKFIQEDKAKTIAKEMLEKIGYENEEIESIEPSKNFYETDIDIIYKIKTQNGLEIDLDGENGNFIHFDYSDLIKQRFENEEMDKEDIKNISLGLYNKFDFLNRGYEFYKCNCQIIAQGVGSSDSSDYKQYTKSEYLAIFYEKQKSGILNKFKGITISFYIKDGKTLISGIGYSDTLGGMRIYKNIEYVEEDNEVKLSENMAIEIAKEKDKSIFNKKIKYTRTQLINDMTSYDVWAWEKGYTYEDLAFYVQKENASAGYSKYYYDKYYIRNVYEVTIIYDVKNGEINEKDILSDELGKVYYIDVTTGEILGGRNLRSDSEDIEIVNDYLFDEEDNYTVYKTTYYDAKTGEIIYVREYDLPEEAKNRFTIKKDERPNPVSYNIY